MICNSCFYCTRDTQLNDLMIEIAPLQVSTLYLLRDQTYRGRCVIALNDHQTELFHIQREEQPLFMEDVAKAAFAIQQTFHPDKINYAIYGDLVSHVHYHLVPKYKNGYTWGEAFINAPSPKLLLNESSYLAQIDLIRKHLSISI
jgi:diadenosine tetraphosphate (Ap4A) HIT family hydrolase